MISQSEMTKAEQRRGGRVVKDETTGQFRVEWEYAKSDDEEQPIAFRKDDETAIDAETQSRNSAKRAKKDAKNRLKAERAAESARRGLNRSSPQYCKSLSNPGAEMREDPVVTVAKAWAAGGNAPRITKKVDFYKALVRLSEQHRQPGETREVAFSKLAMSNDPTARALWAAYRNADGPEPTTWSGEDDEAGHTPTTSPGYDAMIEKAKKLMAKNPGKYTLAKAFEVIYSGRPDLVEIDKRHHAERVAKAMGG